MGLFFVISKMDIYSLLNLSLIFIIPFLLFFLQRSTEETRKLPPGPFKLPIIGNLYQMMGDLPHRSLQRLSNIYGPIMFLKLGSKPALVISSADMLRQIFKTHDTVFSGRPVLYAVKRLTYNCIDITFSSYGEYWREVRKLAVLELLSIKKVQSFRAVREEEVALMIASIGASEGPIDLSETFLHITNDVICRVALGKKFDLKNGFRALFRETQELVGGLRIADFFPSLRWVHKIDGLHARVEKNFQTLDGFFNEIIEEHQDPKRTKAEVEDFVDVMLRVQAEDISKFKPTNNHIKALILDMFEAGTDPAAATLVWTMTLLMKNPIIMKKAQDEMRIIVGKKAMVEESDLPHLNYIKLILKESMRLHPVNPLLVIRETTDKCIIEGYNIPAKTWVFINAKSVMMDAKSWEKPEEFWPERFQDNPIDFKGKDHEFIPFGLGRRICPGIDFALSVTELVLANLLYCFNWELPQGVESEKLDMKEVFGIAIHKKIPLCLIAKGSNLFKNA